MPSLPMTMYTLHRPRVDLRPSPLGEPSSEKLQEGEDMVVAEKPQSEYRVRVIEAVSTIAEDEEEEVGINSTVTVSLLCTHLCYSLQWAFHRKGWGVEEE